MIRPGTDPALALGLAQVIVKERRYDETFVKRFTDLPRLVRLDTGAPLLARDVFPGHRDSELANWTQVVKRGETAPPTIAQNGVQIPESLRGEFGDWVAWDATAGTARRRRPRSRRRPLRPAGDRPGAGGQFPGRPGRRHDGGGPAGLRRAPSVPGRHADPGRRLEDHLGAGRGDRGPGPPGGAPRRPDAVRRGDGAQPVLQQRPEGPGGLPARRVDRLHRPARRQRRLLRRQLPEHALLGHAALDHRGPVRPAARPRRPRQDARVPAGGVAPLLRGRRGDPQARAPRRSRPAPTSRRRPRRSG